MDKRKNPINDSDSESDDSAEWNNMFNNNDS